MSKHDALLIAGFTFVYTVFVLFFDVQVAESIASEIILASVFFFAFFAGYFITRQNERYSEIITLIANREGAFSSLYRISGLVPHIQDSIREIVRAHYRKILDSDDWAYHEFHPSTTIKSITDTFGTLSKADGERPAVSTSYEMLWSTILELQQIRKRIIALYHERLSLPQWSLLLTLAGILVVSLDFLRSDIVLIDLLKIVFGTAVFMVLILIKQLNELSIFGKHFSRNTARDVLRILDEEDARHFS